MKEREKERPIAVPGEIIAKDPNLLPGEGTRREGQFILATRFGLVETTDKLIRIIPLSGVYLPRVGDVVLGRILDITWNGWIVDIKAPQLAFLLIAESGRFIRKELSEYFSYGDMIVTKIKQVKARGIDLTMKGAGLRKLEGGMIIAINPSRVPRVIGRAGSMIEMIKRGTGCQIIVGQNGLIWIKGRTAKEELLAKEAIDLVATKPFLYGLTERVKAFIEESRKNVQTD